MSWKLSIKISKYFKGEIPSICINDISINFALIAIDFIFLLSLKYSTKLWFSTYLHSIILSEKLLHLSTEGLGRAAPE